MSVSTTARRSLTLLALSAIVACAPSSGASPSTSADPGGTSAGPSASSPPILPGSGSLVIVGRIVTMDEPPVAEALLIEDGIGDRGRHPGRGAGTGR